MFMNIFLANAIIVLVTFMGMEFMAWFSHKYLMHGWLWSWHEDHHDHKKKSGHFWEKNDRFFLVFAIPSAISYILGTATSLGFFLYIGIGISIYGLVYFLIHDVYIHKRFKWFKTLDSAYSRAILRAHGAHHAKRTKEDGESFGLLIVHPKYFDNKKDALLKNIEAE
jgi:beta-carotene 3-hydroxylase